MDPRIGFGKLRITGTAECVGGKHPDPPLYSYPLLAWAPEHPRHGSHVFTEDGRATVADLVLAVAEAGSYHGAAARYGTTTDHVAQAVDYALAAGLVSA